MKTKRFSSPKHSKITKLSIDLTKKMGEGTQIETEVQICIYPLANNNDKQEEKFVRFFDNKANSNFSQFLHFSLDGKVVGCWQI